MFQPCHLSICLPVSQLLVHWSVSQSIYIANVSIYLFVCLCCVSLNLCSSICIYSALHLIGPQSNRQFGYIGYLAGNSIGHTQLHTKYTTTNIGKNEWTWQAWGICPPSALQHIYTYSAVLYLIRSKTSPA